MDPLYALRLETNPVARVRLDWPPGRVLLDLVLFSTATLRGVVDELRAADPLEVRGLDSATVEFSQAGRGSLFDGRRAVLRSYPDRLEYWLELEGHGALDGIALFEVSVAATEPGGWRKVLPWRRPGSAEPIRHASGGRFSTLFRPRPGSASGERLPAERRLEIDALADPPEPGAAAAAGRPVFGLGEAGRWVVLGLQPDRGSERPAALGYRGEGTWSLRLSYANPIEVRGGWRSPVVVLLPIRDEAEGLAAYERWLERSASRQR